MFSKKSLQRLNRMVSSIHSDYEQQEADKLIDRMQQLMVIFHPLSPSFYDRELPMVKCQQCSQLINANGSDYIAENYKTLEWLSRQDYGRITLLKSRHTEKLYLALKVISKAYIEKQNLTEGFKNSLQIHKNLKNSSIAYLYEYGQYKGDYLLALELHQKTLLTEMHQKTRFSEREIINILQDILNGLIFMFKKGHFHHNIRPSTISKFKRKYKISSLNYYPSSRETIQKENDYLFHYPPEQLTLKQIDPKSSSFDVWSLGVLTHQLYTGYPPFTNSEIRQVRNGFGLFDVKGILRKFEKNSMLLKLVSSMLQNDIKDRKNLQELLVLCQDQ